MKNTLLHQAAKFKLQNRKHKRWQKAVSILACIVVFCTVYALILPALTAEGTPHCGIEEHTHTDECYENRLICGKEEGEGAHTHTDECYTQEQTLICGREEGEGAHTHTEECYDEEGNLKDTSTQRNATRQRTFLPVNWKRAKDISTQQNVTNRYLPAAKKSIHIHWHATLTRMQM